MHSRSRSVRAILGAGALLAGGLVIAGAPDPASPAALAAAPWKMVAASGVVEAHPPAITEVVWRAVARGEELAPRTSVRTGKRGRATLTRSGSILVVDRDSRVDLPAFVAPGSPSSVTQTQGRVVYKIEKADSKHFEVVTPYLVAGVKGTTFLVTVKDHTASVSVREGVVEVTSAMTGERLDVHAGETVLLGAQSEGRMELASLSSGVDSGRSRKGDAGERARQDASRMTSLLDSGTTAGSEVSAGLPLDPTRDGRTGETDPLDGAADGGRRTGGADAGPDPLQDPIDLLPIDLGSGFDAVPPSELPVIDSTSRNPSVPLPPPTDSLPSGPSGPGSGLPDRPGDQPRRGPSGS